MKNKNNTSRLFRPRSALLLAFSIAGLNAFGVQPAHAVNYKVGPRCDENSPLCTDPADHLNYEGKYIGHDEPSLLYYSGLEIPMFTCSPCPRTRR